MLLCVRASRAGLESESVRSNRHQMLLVWEPYFENCSGRALSVTQKKGESWRHICKLSHS
jgi:hypothetical protein